MSSFDLNGKVALVTGAERGIGYETARALSARGASVAIVDIDLAATERAASTIGTERVLALAADVTDRDAIAQAVDQTVDRFGGLDVVVANAGIGAAPATLRVMDPAVVERVIEVDLLGVWRTVRPALPHIVERRGHVVVVASVYAFMNGVLTGPYAISKAGVEQMGRILRAELAVHGATAGVAYFGFVDTELVRDAFSDPVAERLAKSFPSFLTRRISAAAAGDALARGVERRAARTIAPRWWSVLSTARGVLNPLLDRRLERDAKFQAVVRKADTEGRVAGHPIVALPDRD